MRIINFQVDLTGVQEITLNGRRLDTCRAEIEEKVISKLGINQQYALVCETWKMLNILVDNYNKSRVRLGEISHDDYDKSKAKIISAGSGIPGILPALPRGKFTGKT